MSLQVSPDELRAAAIKVGLVVAALSLLLVIGPWRPSERGRAYSAEGYVDVVNDVLIPQQVLRADVSADRPAIFIDPEALTRPNIRRFLHSSFLGTDLGNPDLWTVRNSIVTRLDPNSHDIPLPTDPRRIWRGALTFDGAAATRPTLTGSIGEIYLTAPSYSEDGMLREMRSEDVQLWGAGEAVRAQEVRLYEDNPLRDAVRLRLAGDAVIVRVTRGAGISVRVGGRTVAENSADIAVRGEEILFVSGDKRAILTVGGLGRRAEEISEFRMWSAREHAEVTRPLGEAFDRAMARAMSGAADDALAETLSETDVHTTLDREIAAPLDALLHRYMRRPDFNGERGHVAAITILDAVSGEIVALASAEANPPSTDGVEWNVDRPIDANFRRLQIGSAAKPIISTLILDEQPSLRSLRVTRPAERMISQLLGTRFDGPDLDTGLGGAGVVVDFNRFIQTSDNYYAAVLLLLSAPTSSDRRIDFAAPIEIAGETHTWRRPSAFERLRSDGAIGFDYAPGYAIPIHWDDELRLAFDVDYETGPSNTTSGRNERCRRGGGRLGDDARDITIWAPLLNAGLQSVTPCDFAAVSPEREVFGFESMTDFRTQLIPVILGGGEARWTNIKLAQAYARLIVGRKIQASIVHGAPRSEFEPLGLVSARDVVTRAMSLVPLAGGTAGSARGPSGLQMSGLIDRLSQSAAADGEVVGVFGKTGTPEIEFPGNYRSGRAINRLIAAHWLRLRDEALALYPRTGAPIIVSERNVGSLRRALENDRAAYDLIRTSNSSPAAVARQLVEDAGAENIDAIYDTAGGRTLVHRRADRLQTGFGKVFAFVVARYRPSVAQNGQGLAVSASAAPEAAYVVTINIQRGASEREDERIATNWAADLSVDVVDQFVAPLLRTERRRERAND